MADIRQWLKQQAHIERAGVEMHRESIHDYKMLNSEFKLPLGKLKEEGGLQQFCSFYYKRLESLRAHVKEAAELKWGDRGEFVENILDLKPGIITVIIGTLFKEQKKKPCVFKNLTGVINTVPAIDLSFGALDGDGNPLANEFISEADLAILEDASGRITINENCKFKIDEQITGSIIAVLGKADNSGYFNVIDSCRAGISFQADLPRSVNLCERGLFDES